jgi:hypothetical protein
VIGTSIDKLWTAEVFAREGAKAGGSGIYGEVIKKRWNGD